MDWTGCEVVEQVPGDMGLYVVRHSGVSPEQVLRLFENDGTAFEIATRLGLSHDDVDDVLEFAYMQDWSQADATRLASITAPPMDWTGCDYVECVPGRMSGVPVVRDSRVSAETIVTGMLMGETAQELAYQFSLKLSEVRGIMAFSERQLPLAKAG